MMSPRVRLTLVLLLLFVAAARGQGLPVAGDEGHLWVLRPGAEVGQTLVLHRGPGDPPGEIEAVETLTGMVRPNGVASRGAELWLIYSDGAIQSIRAAFIPEQRAWGFEGGTFRPLPTGAELRGFAVGMDGPWVLARMTDAEAAAVLSPAEENGPALDRQRQMMRNLSLGLPPTYRLAPEGESQPAVEETPVEAPAPDADADEIERDYLLQLAGARWRTEPLPEAWSLPDESWLVLASAAARPTLLARTSTGVASHTWEGGAWVRQVYELPRGPLRPLSVAGQVVVAQEVGSSPLRVAVDALRPERAVAVGELTLEGGADAAWGAAAAGLSIAIVTAEPATPAAEPEDGAAEAPTQGVLSSITGAALPPLGLRWARLDLLGDVVQEATPLERTVHHPLENRADYAVMLAIAGLAMLMLLVFWRRDPTWTRLELPNELVLAELPRRALAGAIDFAPPVLIVMQLYRLDLLSLLQLHWPGAVSSFEALVPGAVAIGIFVAHTTVAELFGGRSLGKLATGLRVVDLKGRRPKAWQVLVRNALKAFDLVAPLLLVLPAIGPLRQRLGDLIGRTVVVVPRGDEDGDAADEDNV